MSDAKQQGPLVLVRKESDHVWVISINRPHVRNCIDRPTAAMLSQIVSDFEKDSLSRVAVLHGEGGVFCAGADLTAIADRDPHR